MISKVSQHKPAFFNTISDLILSDSLVWVMFLAVSRIDLSMSCIIHDLNGLSLGFDLIGIAAGAADNILPIVIPFVRGCRRQFGISVALKKSAKRLQGYTEGTYKSFKKVNGRTSYLSSDKIHALWLSKELGSWMVGMVEDLGSSKGCLCKCTILKSNFCMKKLKQFPNSSTLILLMQGALGLDSALI